MFFFALCVPLCVCVYGAQQQQRRLAVDFPYFSFRKKKQKKKRKCFSCFSFSPPCGGPLIYFLLCRFLYFCPRLPLLLFLCSLFNFCFRFFVIYLFFFFAPVTFLGFLVSVSVFGFFFGNISYGASPAIPSILSPLTRLLRAAPTGGRGLMGRGGAVKGGEGRGGGRRAKFNRQTRTFHAHTHTVALFTIGTIHVSRDFECRELRKNKLKKKHRPHTHNFLFRLLLLRVGSGGGISMANIDETIMSHVQLSICFYDIYCFAN